MRWHGRCVNRLTTLAAITMTIGRWSVFLVVFLSSPVFFWIVRSEQSLLHGWVYGRSLGGWCSLSLILSISEWRLIIRNDVPGWKAGLFSSHEWSNNDLHFNQFTGNKPRAKWHNVMLGSRGKALREGRDGKSECRPRIPFKFTMLWTIAK